MKNTVKKIFLLITSCCTLVGMDDSSHAEKKVWAPKIVLDCNALVFCMVYSSDVTKLAVGRCGADAIYIYDTTKMWEDGEKKFWQYDTIYKCPDSSALAYSPDDTSLVVCCSSKNAKNFKKMKVFDTKTWRSKTILAHDGLASSILYSHNGKQLALHLRIDQDKGKSKVCIFNTADWKCETTFDHDEEIRSLSYTPDDATLWIRFKTRISKIFETKSWECLAQVHDDPYNIESVTLDDVELITEILKKDGYGMISGVRSPDDTQLAIGSMPLGKTTRSPETIKRGKVWIFDLLSDVEK